MSRIVLISICQVSHLPFKNPGSATDGELSDPHPILYGVSQGSLLGPLLFIVYINDLPSVIKHCKIQLYADDTLVYFSSSSINDIESKLSEDLESVINWLNSNFLFFNYSKTKVVFTGTNQRLASVDSFTVKAKDTILSRVYQFKYLGVVLDPCLSWNEHIDYMGRKISARLGMLRKAHKVIPRESCITMYNAMILPLFDYSAVIWDCCGKTNRDYLDKLQRRADSIIKGHRIPQSQVYHTFSWLSLQSRRDYLKCMLVFKCIHGLAPPYLLNEFSHSREYHSYNTRHRDLLRLPLARTPKYQASFRYSGAKTWNTLLSDLRNVRDMSLFRIRPKKHFRC